MARIHYEDRYIVELPSVRAGAWMQVRGEGFATVVYDDATLFRSAAEAERWAEKARARGEEAVVCDRAVGVRS